MKELKCNVWTIGGNFFESVWHDCEFETVEEAEEVFCKSFSEYATFILGTRPGNVIFNTRNIDCITFQMRDKND